MSTGRCLALACGLLLSLSAVAADRIVVGSKIFTEGYVLGELAAQTLEASNPGVPVVRKLGMGSTGVLFESLNSGAIDVYSDYTGTLAAAILKNPQLRAMADVRSALLKTGIVISDPARLRQYLRAGRTRGVCQARGPAHHRRPGPAACDAARRFQLRIHGSAGTAIPGWPSATAWDWIRRTSAAWNTASPTRPSTRARSM